MISIHFNVFKVLQNTLNDFEGFYEILENTKVLRELEDQEIKCVKVITNFKYFCIIRIIFQHHALFYIIQFFVYFENESYTHVTLKGVSVWLIFVLKLLFGLTSTPRSNNITPWSTHLYYSFEMSHTNGTNNRGPFLPIRDCSDCVLMMLALVQHAWLTLKNTKLLETECKTILSSSRQLSIPWFLVLSFSLLSPFLIDSFFLLRLVL